MKNYIAFCLFFSLLSLSTCEKNDSEVVGTWLLTEVLADPGDGSGVFTPVDSDRVIQLKDDGTYSANGDLCDFQIVANSSSSGLYDLEEGTISPENCATIGGTPIGLSVDGSTMIITYLCIEACQHKYERQ